MIDPYPSKLNDSKLWERLLDLALSTDEYMAGILYWYRAVGTKLVLNTKHGFVMEPIITNGETWGWRDRKEWNEERQWLLPYKDLVSKLLIELRIEVTQNA